MIENGLFFVDEVLYQRCGAFGASMKLFELVYYHALIDATVHRVSLSEDSISHIFAGAVWDLGQVSDFQSHNFGQELLNLSSRLEKGLNDGSIRIHQASFLLETYTKKLKWVHDIIAAEGPFHGAALIRRIESSIAKMQGDYEMTSLATGILNKCLRPVIEDLSSWLIHGTLKSKHLLIQKSPMSDELDTLQPEVPFFFIFPRLSILQCPILHSA